MTRPPARGTRGKVHIIGIGGIGAGSLAAVLREAGYVVTGSEPSRTTLAQEILDLYPDIRVFRELAAAHVADADWVIYSVAFDADNIELVEAQRRGIRISTYPEALGTLLSDPATTDGAAVCAVAGTHGKTTTTGMVTQALEATGGSASYIIGGPMQGNARNARFRAGSPFVLEADEYRGAFLRYARHVSLLVITNIDFDHPDCYPSQKSVEEAFGQLLDEATGLERAFACGDSPGVQAVLEHRSEPVQTYGFGDGHTYRIDVRSANAAGSSFTISGPDLDAVPVTLGLTGRHNVLNATGAFLAAWQMGSSTEGIAESLGEYVGARRRFEVVLDTDRAVVVDDYAHHPAAVASFIEAMRQRYPDRQLTLVFQPHTLTRTVAMFDDFVRVLRGADAVAVLDVYAGREAEAGSAEPGVLATKLREALRSQGMRTFDASEPDQLVAALAASCADTPTAFATVGAGDLWRTITTPLRAALT